MKQKRMETKYNYQTLPCCHHDDKNKSMECSTPSRADVTSTSMFLSLYEVARSGVLFQHTLDSIILRSHNTHHKNEFVSVLRHKISK